MKKWPVLVAALLLAIAGGLKLLGHKTSPEGAGSPPGQEPAGVSPPGAGTQYYIPGEFSAVPPRSGAPSTYGALPTIKNKLYDSGPCKGGSLNEIFSAHGRIWGYLAPYGAFLNADNTEMYDLLGRYLACAGLANRNPSFCDYLPGESRGGMAVVSRAGSPNDKCLGYYQSVSTSSGPAEACPGDQRGLCSAFISKSEASCSALLAKAGSSYCAYLAKAQKRAGGYAGFSPEE
ncbi:MAG: hypothetical protein Q8O90_11795, partial [Elusimicrobiota bacterium]|nr:hypothetical protein [Elusimicrobiota bacterium]